MGLYGRNLTQEEKERGYMTKMWELTADFDAVIPESQTIQYSQAQLMLLSRYHSHDIDVHTLIDE